MLTLRESRIVRVLAIFLLAWLPACASLGGQRSYDPSAPSFEENEPAEGVLVLSDGTSRRAEGIWAEGDSLFAFEPGTIGRVNEAQIRLARSDVRTVREIGVPEPQTTFGVVAILAAVALMAYSIGNMDMNLGWGR